MAVAFFVLTASCRLQRNRGGLVSFNKDGSEGGHGFCKMGFSWSQHEPRQASCGRKSLTMLGS